MVPSWTTGSNAEASSTVENNHQLNIVQTSGGNNTSRPGAAFPTRGKSVPPEPKTLKLQYFYPFHALFFGGFKSCLRFWLLLNVPLPSANSLEDDCFHCLVFFFRKNVPSCNTVYSRCRHHRWRRRWDDPWSRPSFGVLIHPSLSLYIFRNSPTRFRDRYCQNVRLLAFVFFLTLLRLVSFSKHLILDDFSLCLLISR